MRSHRSVLIVEDDARDLDLMLAAISQVDETVHAEIARDGVEALDHLARTATRSDPPALAILDVKLPRLSGHEVLRQARKARRFWQMPIVMMSGSQLPADVEAAYELGANGYVQKPLRYRDFVELVRATLDFWLGHNIPPPAAPA